MISFCSALWWQKVFNFYAFQCVNELLFHLPKLSKFSETCFTTTEEIVLTPFNLAHPVRNPHLNEAAVDHHQV